LKDRIERDGELERKREQDKHDRKIKEMKDKYQLRYSYIIITSITLYY